MLEEMLLGSYLAELDRTLARMVPLLEAEAKTHEPAYGRVARPFMAPVQRRLAPWLGERARKAA